MNLQKALSMADIQTVYGCRRFSRYTQDHRRVYVALKETDTEKIESAQLGHVGGFILVREDAQEKENTQENR